MKRTALPLLWFGINALAFAPAGAGRLSFPPSHGPVSTVLLSYTRQEGGLQEKLPNPRLELIKEVRRIFPHLDIKLTSELAPERLFLRHPELVGQINGVVRVENMTSIQDPFEFARDSSGRLTFLAFDNPVYKGAEALLALFPGARKIAVSTFGKGRVAGGNAEFLPDGTPVLGKNVPSDAVDFFARVSGKRPIQVDSGWTSSGDLDEVFLWTKDPLNRAKCILFHLDVRSGGALLTPKNLEEYVESEVREMKALMAPFGVPFDELELRKRFRAEADSLAQSSLELGALQALIESEARKILSHPAMKRCRSERLPILYLPDLENYPQGGHYRMGFQNQINSLVIENHAFMLRSELPAQQRAVEFVFRKNGFVSHSFSAKAFDGGGGNMHCSTAAIRR